MSARPDAFPFLIARPFAHRGLHGGRISENGMAAFAAAIAGGFGIECDVRLSRDNVAIVFHDAVLRRMTGENGAVQDHDAGAIDRLMLPDGGGVPRLRALLDLCGTDVPLLIEIKVDGRHVGPICVAVADDLARRPKTPAAVMSFNPVAMRWFRRHRPMVARGLVITEQGKRGWRDRIGRALALWAAKPDFIACDIRDLPSSLSVDARRRGLPVLTWTVRGEEQRARAALHADQIIFERSHD
ncbi:MULTISPECIES: glycerophosphodiester phosphodiesterase family protein [Sphingobium]|uniref:Glycerophosphoryl diester phosphodiesterase n=1 Tax=Sphingobium fuliginis (strain ATCC 27551) TaxID=336203 RepID=A0A292ZKZ7_SPHSA|nr:MULTISPECIES: glycerophosphodiester phosphodiesterase family protein [Sphingobium]OAP33012.1 glycerophosphodiester phosphodiesterase [Sphingobium sp. 20006FA]KXU33182.1 glycerophosphodiester phosphodiesterase [Sphingobium sp. AM]KYC32011.1 glycerophosphodiester phosphodiesterase [Sphingobium sp. 22B]PNP97043.1 glycerophosphodiester phosphodiesterase [Sphingobium sp. SA916]GAY23543.1 glycerophosphoryl diester phosphodiesterase [Sphingobium fuliginis]